MSAYICPKGHRTEATHTPQTCPHIACDQDVKQVRGGGVWGPKTDAEQ